MSDNDDLFAESDSDDTTELISSSISKKKSAAASKKQASAAAKKKKDNDNDEDKGLFDSDSDDDDGKKDSNKKKPAAKKKLQKQPAAGKDGGGGGKSKRERLEALAKRRKADEPGSGSKASASASGSGKSKDKDGAKTGADGEKKSGYESEDSVDSAEIQRTKEDDDFLDTTGEDPDAVQELYAEQHFDDEPEEEGYKKKKKRKIRYDEAIEDNNPDGTRIGREDVEPDNPIMAAVHRMKKKRTEKKSLTEIEDECRAFLKEMETAADEDETAIAERRPAMKKLGMLNQVVEKLTRVDMQRMLLDLELLTICRRWIQPLPNGTLGNVTIRQRLLEVIATMTGETGITPSDLKRSEFGKTVMVLYKHRSETPKMKQLLKTLIEQWSRPIFQKSGNMRDLERVHRGEGSFAAIRRQQQLEQQHIQQQQQTKTDSAKQTRGHDDLDSLITKGKKGGAESGINRVRVPFSKGFAFSVRPVARDAAATETPAGGPGGARRNDTRGNLTKRMLEKRRPVGKNQRSANISIEGRPTK